MAKFNPCSDAPVARSTKPYSFTPTTSPSRFKRGPPELPGFMAASV